jgi:transposase
MMGGGWPNQSNAAAGWRTHIPSRAFAHCNESKGCSVIRVLDSSPWSAGEKAICGTCGTAHRGWYDRRQRRVRDLSCADHRIYLDLEVRRVDCRQCGAVKRERLDFLVENALHTKRFALYVGRRCRSGTIRDVAEELRLDWQTVKRLEVDYMREQIRRVGSPGPKVIGIDEISIRKGHTYRIVVSDLERRRPIYAASDLSEK